MYLVIRTTKRVPSPATRASNPDYPPIGIGGRHIAGKLDPTFPRLFAIARNCWLLKRQGQLRLSFAAALVGSEFQIAGVAELADALDSKSITTLGSAGLIDKLLTLIANGAAHFCGCVGVADKSRASLYSARSRQRDLHDRFGIAG